MAITSLRAIETGNLVPLCRIRIVIEKFDHRPCFCVIPSGDIAIALNEDVYIISQHNGEVIDRIGMNRDLDVRNDETISCLICLSKTGYMVVTSLGKVIKIENDHDSDVCTFDFFKSFTSERGTAVERKILYEEYCSTIPDGEFRMPSVIFGKDRDYDFHKKVLCVAESIEYFYFARETVQKSNQDPWKTSTRIYVVSKDLKTIKGIFTLGLYVDQLLFDANDDMYFGGIHDKTYVVGKIDLTTIDITKNQTLPILRNKDPRIQRICTSNDKISWTIDAVTNILYYRYCDRLFTPNTGVGRPEIVAKLDTSRGPYYMRADITIAHNGNLLVHSDEMEDFHDCVCSELVLYGKNIGVVKKKKIPITEEIICNNH